MIILNYGRVMRYIGENKKAATQSEGAHWRSRPKASNRVSSDELLAGEAELEIEHHGQIYRLRPTRQGKLLLTK